MNYYTYQDVYYTSSAHTLEYVIKLGDEYIFRGLAVRGPEDCFAYINVGEICRQYLSNSIPDFTDFSNNRVVQNKMVLTFGLYAVLIDRDYTCPEEWEDIVVEEFLEDYTFLYNWDYEGLWDGTDRVISDPVNGHLDCRMKAMLTEFREIGDFDFYVTPTLYSPASGATLHAVISSETLTEDEKLTITITDNSITYSSLSMTGVDFIVPANTGNSKNAVVHYYYDGIHVGSTLIMIESEYGCYIDPSWKYSTYTDLSLTAYELETVTGYTEVEYPMSVLVIAMDQQETDKNIDMTISGTTHFIIEKRKYGTHQANYAFTIRQLNNETPQLGETFTASMFMNNQLYTSWTVTVTQIIGFRTYIGEGDLFAQTEDYLPIKVMPIDYVYTDDVVLPEHPEHYFFSVYDGFVYNRYISAYHTQDPYKIVGTGFEVRDTFWTSGFYADGSECYNTDMLVDEGSSNIWNTTIFNLAGNGDLARFYTTQHFDCPIVHVYNSFRGTLLGFPSAQSILIHVHSGVTLLDLYFDNVTLEEFNALPLPPIHHDGVGYSYNYPAYRTKLYVFHRQQFSTQSMNITVHCKDGVTSWSPDLYMPD